MFIGCKLPNGLNIDGHVVDGNHAAYDQAYRNLGQIRPIVGGYQITSDFPDAVWEQWISANLLNPVVANKMILAASTKEELEALCGQNVKVGTPFRPASGS
jgi:hypothetical protein